MKGIHVWWSKIGLVKGQTVDDYYIEDYNLLILILSCLHWRRDDDLILYTDEIMLNFLEKNNLTFLWSDIDVKILQNIPVHIDPIIQWSAANVFSIANTKVPFCMLDTDLIYRKKFDYEADLVCGHYEKLIYPVYPELRLFISDLSQYEKYKWESDPVNASFLSFQNQKLVDEYSNLAINFVSDPMQQIRRNFDYLNVRSNFVDQRLLAEVASNYKVKSIINDIYYPYTTRFPIWKAKSLKESNRVKVSEFMTHIWNEKKVVARYDSAYIDHMQQYLQELQEFFPQHYDSIVETLQKQTNWQIQLPSFY